MKSVSPSFLPDQEVSHEPAGEGITRQIMGYDARLMLVKVLFSEGARGYVHSHPHSQTTYVVSGRFTFTIDGIARIVTAGDGLYMAPDVPHGCECLEAGLLIDVFSPLREDFLG